MGLQIHGHSGSSSSATSSHHHHTRKMFLLCNYVLLGAASSCIFLTLSLRLFPSLSGFFFILLQAFTVALAVAGCTGAITASNRCYGAHMSAAVLTAIFQGAVAVLVFSRTGDFLGALKSYVREEDGAVILRLAGGLCVLIFCLEWVGLTLAFALRYYAFVEGGDAASSVHNNRGSKTQGDDDLKNFPWPFQV